MGDVNVNIKGLEQFRDQLAKMDVDAFCRAAAKELAARLLRKVIKRSPVDTGTFRRGWTSDDSGGTKQAMYDELFGGSQSVLKKDMSVRKQGSDYVIEVKNSVDYASYVEYGHRTRGHSGWVEGAFALTISEDEIRNSAPQILEAKFNKWLREVYK